MGGDVNLKFSISIELGLAAHSISSRLRSLDSNSYSSFDSSVIFSLLTSHIFNEVDLKGLVVYVVGVYT